MKIATASIHCTTNGLLIALCSILNGARSAAANGLGKD